MRSSGGDPAQPRPHQIGAGGDAKLRSVRDHHDADRRSLATLTDESETATALRQASPFSFAIDPKTRQRILRDTVTR